MHPVGLSVFTPNASRWHHAEQHQQQQQQRRLTGSLSASLSTRCCLTDWPVWSSQTGRCAFHPGQERHGCNGPAKYRCLVQLHVSCKDDVVIDVVSIWRCCAGYAGFRKNNLFSSIKKGHWFPDWNYVIFCSNYTSSWMYSSQDKNSLGRSDTYEVAISPHGAVWYMYVSASRRHLRLTCCLEGGSICSDEGASA